ncbi:hypothetical protein B0T10DRAFT_365398, partial [Thelonectria olida]
LIDVGCELKPQCIAVSYQWPRHPDRDHQLTSGTWDHFSMGYSTKDLPLVYCDAFIVARMLGFRQSNGLKCIMQGMGGDWHVEASKMASVYGNAVFTLAFGDGPELNYSGKAEVWRRCSLRDATQAAAQPFIKEGRMTDLERRSPESIYTWLESNGNFPTRPSSELDKRGWTFQERILSKRVLTISAAGLFWDCCQSSASDTRPLGLRGDFSPKLRDSDERKINTQLLTGSRDDSTVSRPELYLLWRTQSANYTWREFSHPRDRIVAIEGVVHRIGAVLNECFLGIWKGDFLRSLIWFCDKMNLDALPAKNNNSVCVPSWSWASISFPIQYRLWHPFARCADHNVEFTSPCASLQHISAQTTDKTSLSCYTGAITLSGTIARVLAHSPTNSNGQVILDPRPLEAFPGYSKEQPTFLQPLRNGPDSWRALLHEKSGEIYLLPMLKGGYFKTLRAHYCLLL